MELVALDLVDRILLALAEEDMADHVVLEALSGLSQTRQATEMEKPVPFLGRRERVSHLLVK